VVRRAAVGQGTPDDCRRRIGLDPDTRTLFVTGASQGASSINRLLEAMLERRRDAFDGWQAIHQTGGGDEAARVREAYEKAGVPARVEAFFTQMADCWGAADLAVSRAGAGSVGEAWANGVPTVFLPYPYHRDEHQRLNAQPLEQAGGAVIVRDEVDASKNLAVGGERLASLLGDESSRSEMRRVMATLGPADGARRVASFVCSLDQPAGRA
jgi:UDP-N-acetylglucosamine--N-acetylmuramyl-(pentapeptide) pyrophosphoryl-undecaprenol N-acetylglucosamine transferase